MNRKFVLALDQGTTSSRAILFDRSGAVRGIARREFTQHFPQSGWVEHDAVDLWQTQLAAAQAVLREQEVSAADIEAIGITNQRETTVVWNRHTGAPVHRAIVWQDRRTAAHCEQLKIHPGEGFFRQRTGLVLDAYFSGTKLAWILDEVPGARQQAESGDLLFGNVDSWLIWNLTGGAVHATDASNASRTLLYDVHQGKWSEELCKALNIPMQMLPEVRDSSGFFGQTLPQWFGGRALTIAGVAGDQQAALFGQGCLEPGMAKNTYGTGCFLLLQTGKTPVVSKHGLLTTVAWQLDGKLSYALEGSVFVAGAAIQWLRDGLGLFDRAEDSESLAARCDDSEGVYVVPAFTGLGAPYWDMYARGAIFGLTRGTEKCHLVRATLESLAYQSRDILDAMTADAGEPLKQLRVDGGAAANNLLLQFQADLLGIPVWRPAVLETTALGAACLAGLPSGFFTLEDLKIGLQSDRSFEPAQKDTWREERYLGWQDAVRRSMGWLKDREPAPTVATTS
ncbi:MAG: glycerol kinase GlpK [Bacteroidetes bacterium]|nr:glycerol kinase GlpK [Bacteroidota bacterium]